MPISREGRNRPDTDTAAVPEGNSSALQPKLLDLNKEPKFKPAAAPSKMQLADNAAQSITDTLDMCHKIKEIWSFKKPE